MKRSITAQAAAFVEGARFEYGTKAETRAAILSKLTEIVNERQDLAAILAGTDSPAQDFAGIGPAPSPDTLAELEANTQQRRAPLAARIATLEALFCAICQESAAAGLTFSGGEISPLKRRRIPGQLAAELDAIKRGHRATIPERERLGAEDAAALWDGLTRQGLISGPAATFAYYLGQLSNREPKGQESALYWCGTPMQFAYFIKRFAAVQTARLRSAGVFERYESAGNNTAALCLAFGKDPNKIAALFKDLELQEENAKERQTQAAKERRAAIDAVFNTLPSLNK